MRWVLLTLIIFGSAAAQRPGLTDFLSLTPAQVSSVHQLNDALAQFFQGKAARLNAVQVELAAEYTKPSPNAQALGQRYIEIDSINHELVAQRADVQTKVLALLTPAQIVLVQKISSAIVQQSLIQDASCAYLTDAIPSGNGALLDPATGQILITTFTAPVCISGIAPSVRNVLNLTEGQIAGILAIESGLSDLNARWQNRIAEIEAEIRDETAKPSPDPAALGIQYAELSSISRQLKQSDQDTRATARSLLDSTQQAKLQTISAGSALERYTIPAESCHFLSSPPGTVQADLTHIPCVLN